MHRVNWVLRRCCLIIALTLVVLPVSGCNVASQPAPVTATPAAARETPGPVAAPVVTEAPAKPSPRPVEAVTPAATARPTERPTPASTAAPTVVEEPAETPAPTQPPTPGPTPKPTQPPTPAPTAVLSIMDIVESVTKTMVRVKTDEGNGSGMIVTADGHILTANHVLEKAKDIKIIMPGEKELPGKTLGRDEIRDVGMIKVAGENLKTIPFGKSQDLRVGEEIMAIGFPLDIKGSATVSKGIVSAVRKDADSGVTSIQTDAPVNPGNSGGALVNRKGEVVGVIVSKYVGTGVEGLAFATALDDVTPVLSRLKAGEFIEAPFSKAEPVKKFESKKYLYSFSYPESWKITDTREDQLEIRGQDARIDIDIEEIYGNALYSLSTNIKNWIEVTERAEPDFKVISNKAVNHTVTGVEVVYDRLISGKLTRVAVFYAQGLAGGRTRYMVYAVRASMPATAIKKQQANVDAFLKSLSIQP